MSQIRAVLMMFALLAAAASPLSRADAPVAGRDYQVISPALGTESGNRIEVAEFFWYRCPHCFRLEPALNVWIKRQPRDVAMRRIPAVLNESWALLARAYYTMQALGVADKYHNDLFDAIHVQGQDLGREDALFAWAEKTGMNRKAFADAYQSFAVQSMVLRANQLTRDAKISGVPAFVVDGKYVTSVSMTGSEEALFKTLDALIERARQERPKQPKRSSARQQ